MMVTNKDFMEKLPHREKLMNLNNLLIARDFLLDSFEVQTEKNLPCPTKNNYCLLRISPQLHLVVNLVVPTEKLYFYKRYKKNMGFLVRDYVYNFEVIVCFFDHLGVNRDRISKIEDKLIIGKGLKKNLPRRIFIND